MARKGKLIKIIVHIAEDMKGVFEREEVSEFWSDKIKNRVRNSDLKEISDFCNRLSS